RLKRARASRARSGATGNMPRHSHLPLPARSCRELAAIRGVCSSSTSSRATISVGRERADSSKGACSESPSSVPERGGATTSKRTTSKPLGSSWTEAGAAKRRSRERAMASAPQVGGEQDDQRTQREE